MVTPIFQTLASALAFKPVEPASDLGKNYGFYFGLAGTGTDSSRVVSIFSNLNFPYLPTADIQIGIGFPKGFMLEAGFVPALSYQHSSFERYGAALKWNLTRNAIKKLPMNLGIRLSYSTFRLHMVQDLSGAALGVDYNMSALGAQFLLSKRLFLIEPYAGVGFLNHFSSLSSSGDSSLFGPDFSVGIQSVNASALSVWWQAGLLLKLSVLGIAAEYDRIYDLNSFSGKLSLRF